MHIRVEVGILLPRVLYNYEVQITNESSVIFEGVYAYVPPYPDAAIFSPSLPS
jgi:hypothetical protein